MGWPDLTHTDFRVLHTFCQSLFEHGDVDEIRRETLCFFERALGVEKSNFFLAGSQQQPVSLSKVVTRGVEEEALSRYRRYYWRMDPFYLHYHRLGRQIGAQIVTTEDIIALDQLARTEYYNDFLKQQSIHYQMTVYLRAGPRMLGVVGLFRSRRCKTFSDLDKFKASLVLPYLTGAMERILASERIADFEAIIHSLARDMPNKGVVILDDSLTPIYYDEEAATLLSSLEPATGDSPSLLGELPQGIQRFCMGLADRRSQQDESAVGRSVQEAPVKHVREERVRARLVRSRRGDPLLLLLLEPEEETPGPEQYLRDRGLTRREIQVVQLLTRGLRNTEIADKLCISEYTVENHLRSIYRKMGVRNRTAVAHHLLER